MVSPAPATPVLLRRMARLEATVGRLTQELGALQQQHQALLAAMARQGVALEGPARRRAPARARSSSALPASGGLVGAKARGEAARVQWVRDGLLVPAEALAHAWGLTRQALAAATGRGEVFAVKVGNRLYHPQVFLSLDRAAVARICRALGELDASEKFIFWQREHGALGGRPVAAALDAGTPAERAERLAQAWARERGSARVAAAA